MIEGVGQEFYFIIAAVLGGCLLTGGFGSIVGAALGCLILGMTQQGIPLAGWDNNLYFLFLGVILLVAAFANECDPALGDVGVTTAEREDRAGRRRGRARGGGDGGDGRGGHARQESADEHGRGATSPSRSAATSTVTRCIELQRLSKFFGNIIALQNITTSVRAGEVTCVLGDNGAGKSTFIKILAGVHRHDEGHFVMEGETVTFHSPREAKAAGIATVYQDLAMAPLMSIWRNFWLGSEPTTWLGTIDMKKAKAVAVEELAKMGIDVRDPEQPVGTLSGGERQSVAIARAVYFGAKVLILDEPTAALGVKQSGVVLRYIVAARDRGLGVIFITHNPHHA